MSLCQVAVGYPVYWVSFPVPVPVSVPGTPAGNAHPLVWQFHAATARKVSGREGRIVS